MRSYSQDTIIEHHAYHILCRLMRERGLIKSVPGTRMSSSSAGCKATPNAFVAPERSVTSTIVSIQSVSPNDRSLPILALLWAMIFCHE